MPRTKIVNGKQVALTAQEEAERDAEEAAWAAQESQRQIVELQRNLPQTIRTTMQGYSNATKTAFYRSGLRAALREAIEDGEIALAKSIIEQARAFGREQNQAKNALIAVLNAALGL